MSLIDESRSAFRELRAVMPATIEFNGIEKSGISHSVTGKRIQQLQGYTAEATSSFELEDSDYADYIEGGLKDRVSKLGVTMADGSIEEFVYLTWGKHPCSATVYLFLGTP